MTFNRVMFSSHTDKWNTPLSLYKSLDAEFLFDFDPCPADHNFDGLSSEWGQKNYVNPPYSEWAEWVKKGIQELKKGKMSVFLLPARTDTIAFHDLILPYSKEIRFIRGRLKFSGHRSGAPFPSMIVIFDDR